MNKPITHIPLSLVKELVRYEPETGVFFWVSGRLIGKRADYKSGVGKKNASRNPGGRYLKIDGHNIGANRVAVLLMTGRWPELQVDHENGNRQDNRWANLREATHSQNNMNKRCYRSNKLGLKGIIETSPGKFRAKVDIDKRRIHIGYFDSAEVAFAARLVAIQQIHGSFARAA